MTRYAWAASVQILLFFISGCTLTAPGADPDSGHMLPVEIPARYAHHSAHHSAHPSRRADGVAGEVCPTGGWWRAFGVEELGELIQTALGGSHDLNVLRARADQALANVKRKKSSICPSLDYALGGKDNVSHAKSSGHTAASSDHHRSYSASLSAGYTLDVWGKIRAGIDARELAWLAARQDLADRALTLSTNIADTWVDIVSVRCRMEVLARQIDASQMMLKLQELRFINGMATALVVSRQRQALARVRAYMPLLEKEERQRVNALGLLLGQTPGTPVPVFATALPQGVLAPQPGIPADLLKNRADIRAARMRLQAASLDVEAARADLLPQLTLSASAIFSGGTLDLLFQNWILSLGAALAGPLLDSGDRRAEIERRQAVVREAVHAYGKTVAKAICEVEDVLVAIDRQKRYIERLAKQLTAVEVTLQNARVQYLNGQDSYLNYLSVRTTMEQLTRQLISEQAAYVKARISLYHVTGWQGFFSQETLLQDQNAEGSHENR